MLVSTKKVYFGNVFIFLWYYSKTEKKAQHFNALYKIVLISCSFQLLFYLCYPNELFWTEEGFRFSWRVMLMEKAGYATFKVKDAVTKKKSQSTTVIFNYFQENKWLFNLISF
jgi:hypothetical protein